MKNPRISAKERGLIKGAIRRVFSRAAIRHSVVNKTIITGYTDLSRPRVKTWCKCPECEIPTPKSYMRVDHIEPVVGIKETLEDLSWDTLINRLWCEDSNLQAICEPCHKEKSKAENKARRVHKKQNVKRRKKDKVPGRNSL